MKTVYIERIYPNIIQTLGVLTVPELKFSCKTMELPWKDNASNISCYPVGEYICKWTRSPRLSRESLERWVKKNPTLSPKDAPADVKDVYTYEIFGVAGRAGLRFHPANYSRQLKGCTALGSGTKDLDLDGQNDIIHSGDTCKKFNELMNKEDFKLIVT